MASRIDDLKKRLHDVGFSMDETMEGEHVFEPGMGPEGTHPMRFRVTWGTLDLASFITPGNPGFMRHSLEGAVTVGGLCEDAPCAGTLELRYLTEHKIRYAFTFVARGKQYRYTGEKVNIRAWNLPFSHTTCYGHIVEVESGRLVSRSVTFFKLKTMPAFLWSLSVKRRAAA